MNQNQKVQNPETNVPKNPQMNERDFVNDMLAMEKYMTDAYCTALNEASCQHLYQDVMALFTESQDCQRHMYNLMFKNGWYGIEAADQQKLQQSYQQFSGYSNQLPYMN
ncbi:spore coat protein [Pontibacillus salicampi]|uniref:Spore coat protein n=1 Tax=Pontibacillus salicampi TaxID=1449801 RepID=A0ABV6LN58_9BACI